MADEIQKKLEELQNKQLDDKFTNVTKESAKNSDEISSLRIRIEVIEGIEKYNKGYSTGKDEANKKMLDIVMRSIPILISIIALMISIFKK